MSAVIGRSADEGSSGGYSNSGIFSQASDIDELKNRIRQFTGPDTGSEPVSVGERVLHKKFGEGVVKTRVPESGDFRLDILFVDAGLKRLMESFAKLKKL